MVGFGTMMYKVNCNQIHHKLKNMQSINAARDSDPFERIKDMLLMQLGINANVKKM